MSATRSPADFSRLHTLPTVSAVALLGYIALMPALAYDMPAELRRLVDAAQLELATTERFGQAQERLRGHLGHGKLPWWPAMPEPNGSLWMTASAVRFDLDVPVYWGLSDVLGLAQSCLQQALDKGDASAVRRYADAAGAIANIRRLIGDAIGGQYARASSLGQVTPAKIKAGWALFEKHIYKTGAIFIVPMPAIPESAEIVPGPGVRGPRLAASNGVRE